MLEQFSLSGRVALVTGSARGLGFEIARGMAAAGAQVYINGTDVARLDTAVARLSALGVSVRACCFDVADEERATSAVATIFAEAGRVDILVNNVGMRMRQPLDEIGSAELRRMLEVDLVAPFVLAKLVTPLMARGGYGRIINISSLAAVMGITNDAAYVIAKGGMNAMTRTLAAELGPSGITCNTIMPGSFLTESNPHNASPERREAFRRTPLGRAADPSEIAGPAVFLASDAARFITGVCLPVDGGALIKR